MTMNPEHRRRLLEHLAFLYGHQAEATFARLEARLLEFSEAHAALQSERVQFTERDAILITYGDQFSEPNRTPLQTLEAVLRERFGFITGVHILPFYPYTSDDGFSVVDYRAVDANLGDWPDIDSISNRFALMADLVLNHVSASSAWFQGFLKDDPLYRDYFIVIDPGTDLSGVVRPRALPLLTPFETPSGLKHVWTTFSADQIDLNFRNPNVLLEVIEALLCYVQHGAKLIRLDAVAYAWKEIGTPCIHLEGVHRIVKLFRLVLEAVAPGVAIITETNVPHKDNIAYFGSLLEHATDEAHMVYQFPLPPLVLHTFRIGDATRLVNWLKNLEPPPPGTTFFNFLASHDGLGVMPANGLLEPEEITALKDQATRHGGRVNMRNTPSGTVPYELNITLFDMLSNPSSDEPEDLKINRFIAANAILLSLQGVPGIYIHSLLGSPNDLYGLHESGINRRINRQKFTRATLERELNAPNSRASAVLTRWQQLLKVRASHPAFAPNTPQTNAVAGHGSFFLRRGSDQSGFVECYINVTAHRQDVVFGFGQFPYDLISHQTLKRKTILEPYEVLWLVQEKP
jgi:sucrose phosphorylase